MASHHAASATLSRRKLARRLLLGALFGAVVAVEGVFAVRTLQGSGDLMASGAGNLTGCGGTPLQVAVAPGLAPVVAEAARRLPDSCGISVESAEPVEVLDALTNDSGAVPDVWVPDSTLWLQRAAAAGSPVPDAAESVATSPVVLGLPGSLVPSVRGADGRPDLTEILATHSGSSPVGMTLPNPQESATGVGAVLALQQAVSARPEARPAMIAALRTAEVHPAAETGLRDTELAQVTTEQALVRYNASSDAADALLPAYLPSASLVVDHPWAVLTDDADATALADALHSFLVAFEGRSLLDAEGFRHPDGTAGPLTATAPGVLAAAPAAAPPPDPQAVESAASALEILARPSRLLAVLDVSGSMAAPVPGTWETRMSLAREAAANALSLFPDDADAGLWVFSTDMGPDGDHRELVSLGPVGEREDGSTGRELVTAALPQVEYLPAGDTGLYDTTLAAVREVRAGWSPDRSNLVAILTDGRNDDGDGLSLEQLLETLRDEADPERPVAVLGIAYGPQGDTEALQQIGAATGGALYVSRDPLEIRQVFLDAVAAPLARGAGS